ncbi:MAG TPA: 1-phosphofructokinase family hexose kinase [Longimicrobiales bacterium]
MILTVTPNPSIDLLHETERLVWDDANRVEMPRRRAGGQGINLTRAARLLGGRSEAIAFLGGATGTELKALLDQDPTPHHAVTIAHETRVFVAVRETATGHSMLINARGPVLDANDRARLMQKVDARCRELRPDWLVCSGSIPRGIGDDLYACLVRTAQDYNCKFVADCDGPSLQLAVAAGCELIAPNKHEAARLLGREINGVGDGARAAHDLLEAAPRVLLKLDYEGASLCTRDGCWRARGPVMKQGSSVGAGDAFLAAFLVADDDGAPPEEALRRAVAAGSAVLLSKGSDLLTRADYDAVLAHVVVSEA